MTLTLTIAQMQQASQTGKNPTTGEMLLPKEIDEISAILSGFSSGSATSSSDNKASIFGFNATTGAKGSTNTPGLGIEKENVSYIPPQTQLRQLTTEQEKGRAIVAEELGVTPEELQKYLDVGGQKLGNKTNGISPEDEKNGYYKVLAKEIEECPFKGTKAYLNPEKYTDSINPTDLANQPNCGIGAGNYLKKNSTNEWVKNLPIEQATALTMLLQPDIKVNQDAKKLDSRKCGDKDATEDKPWVFLGMKAIMNPGPLESDDLEPSPIKGEEPQKSIDTTPKLVMGDFNKNGSSSSYDWEIGHLGKDRDGHISVPLPTVDKDGRSTNYNSLLPWVADRDTTTQYVPDGMFITLSENFAKEDINKDGFVTAEEAQKIVQSKHPDYKYINEDKLKGLGIRVQTIKDIEVNGWNAVRYDADGKKEFYRINKSNSSIPFTELLEDIPES